MTRNDLITQIRKKKSFLCIGLDPDPNKIPEHLKEFPDPVLEFCRQIIEATHDLCVAYKPNTAFFESLGANGWKTLHDTFEIIPRDILKIADAKRGDIGNTADQYASAFFDYMKADAVTLSPYMGKDAIAPFLRFPDKWAIVLAVTSNPGALDFQFTDSETGGRKLFEKVVELAATWGSPDNLMFVAGATQAELLGRVRELAPSHFLLVPGIGAQGGNLNDVCRFGMTKDCGLLINSSRNILFAGQGKDFADKAREAALAVQKEMEELLRQHEVI